MSAPSAKSPWPAVGVFAFLAFACSGALLPVQSLIDAELLSVAQFGPALAALATWLLFRGRVRALLPAPVPGRQVRAHTVLMVAAVVLFAAIVGGLALATGADLTGVGAVGGAPFVIYLLLQLLGATGEEIGWRGFMQPLLETRTGRLAAAVITGVVWAAWHIGVFAEGPAVIAAFFVSTIAFAILLGYMGNGSPWQRVLTAATGHWLINVALRVIAGDEVNAAPQVYYTAIGAVVTTAVFMLMFAKARRRRRLQAA